MWFQQNEATSQTTLAKPALQQGKFPGRVISGLNDINWSSCCYLMSGFLFVDFILLKANISHTVVVILAAICQKLMDITSKELMLVSGQNK